MKKVACIALLVALVGVLAAFVFSNTDSSQARETAHGVFDNVIAKDFDKAAEHLYFYDGHSDETPTITQEQGKSMWLERIGKWNASDVSLIGYDNLQFEKDDGALKSYVDLTFDINGEKVVKEDVFLMFTEADGDWKLQYAEHLTSDPVEDWEVALSGHVSSE